MEPEAQPDSTMPYTPSEEQAKITRTPTGRSVSCSMVRWPKIETSGPNGITEKARKAGTVETTGAIQYTGLSASVGMISSLKASFTPSASDCRVPHGPTRLGPIRFCIRPTTLRSNTIENSVITTRNANTPTTLSTTSQNGSCPNAARVAFGSAAASTTLVIGSLHSLVASAAVADATRVTVTWSPCTARSTL